MKLSRALRLGDAPCLALVGSGGKTTALFRLAREYLSGVFLAATTHLGAEQPALADRHHIISSAHEIQACLDMQAGGVSLFTGPAVGERYSGLDEASLEALFRASREQRRPLFIEADGSRSRPLKAPAEHEPAIPSFVDTVVTVAGLSGLGKPLNKMWVHRPERFAALAGINPDDEVTPHALAGALLHAEGGLKNIPASARRLVLLNQADTPELQAQAQGMARRLLGGYGAAVVASLLPPGQGVAAMELSAAPYTVHAVHEQIAGVILAAGESRRMGQTKALLMWRGEPFIRHVIRAAMAAGLSPVVVVSGAAMPLIRAATGDLRPVLVYNPDWQEGQSASIRWGLKALPPECGGAAFLLTDQPQVRAELIQTLVETHAATREAVIAPLIDGRRGTPALFDRVTFPDLLHLQGDVGGRAIFSRYPPVWLPWHDAAMLLDVDSPEDYAHLLALE
ncbi:MAG: putative selenium-dependent hydroxylase accessory protein YqeC [Chloroflexi bacterium]|nr:putative selenium-dependent hydroxylase accessory protein YqeC [Chloroflexota bacterium]